MNEFVVEPLQPFGVKLVGTHAPLSKVNKHLLRHLLDEHALILLRGFVPPEPSLWPAHAKAMVEGHEQLLEWEFGELMELKADPASENYLFSTEKVPMHWDGAFHKEPSFLLFHCLKAPKPGCGGETVFTQTSHLAQLLTAEQRQSYAKIKLTYSTKKLAHYGGQFTTNLFHYHPRTKRLGIRFAEPVTTELNPVDLKVEGIDDPNAFVQWLTDLIYRPSVCITHEWQDGDILIADNHALLHGRHSYSEPSHRHLLRMQII